MKKYFVFAALCVSASAFSHSHHHDIVVVEPVSPVVLVQEAPPVDRVEVIPASPSSDAYWIPGSWQWNNGWAWTSGSWGTRPYAGAVWIPGVWVKHHHRHGWYYTPGHWQ